MSLQHPVYPAVQVQVAHEPRKRGRELGVSVGQRVAEGVEAEDRREQKQRDAVLDGARVEMGHVDAVE